MMPLTAIILIKARPLERLLAIIGSLKILIMRNDIHLYETSYWVSPIPSTGCSKVRSPDPFTELNVFDFTYPTNVLG